MIAEIRLAPLLALMALSPVIAAEPEIDLARRLSSGTIVAISDGDFLAQTYATGQLPSVAAGHRDLLTVLSLGPIGIQSASVSVSNSVTAAPEVLAVTRDGSTAFVVERLAERGDGATLVRDLAQGRRLFAIDISDKANPRMMGSVEIGPLPEAIALGPDGATVAVVSNSTEDSLVQFVTYKNGRFGPVQTFDFVGLGLAEKGAKRSSAATNIQWHPSGSYLAVNDNIRNRVIFFSLKGGEGSYQIEGWGEPVLVGRDPFVGRFSPDGRYYFTSNWGRNFNATDLAGRIPTSPSTISVIRMAARDTDDRSAVHIKIADVETDNSAEGLAISPDGRLVATVNMRGTALPLSSGRFEREASVTLLSFDAASGVLTKIDDYRFEGMLPEGGSFDLTGDHFVATVFQGHDGASERSGAGLEVFEVKKGAKPELRALGRIPLPHGVHHVEIAR